MKVLKFGTDLPSRSPTKTYAVLSTNARELSYYSVLPSNTFIYIDWNLNIVKLSHFLSL